MTGPDEFIPFGIAGAGQTIPAPADYQGYGQDQLAAYVPSSGIYAVRPGGGGPDQYYSIGIKGAGQTIPTPADYFRTGQADVAVYTPSNATFTIVNPSDPSSVATIAFGAPGFDQSIQSIPLSIPAPADYFGTGQADIAVYLTEIGAFAIRNPITGQDSIIPYGKPGVGQSIPVPGDYDGSGYVELAVYIPSAGAFIYHSAITGKDVIVPVGKPGLGTIAAPGDYDGSGHTEAAIYDPDGGFFEYQPAAGGSEVIVPFGGAGNGAIPLASTPGMVAEAMPRLVLVSSGGGTPRFAPVQTSAVSVAVASKASVPSGPMAILPRVARTLVNQGIEDPSPFTT